MSTLAAHSHPSLLPPAALNADGEQQRVRVGAAKITVDPEFQSLVPPLTPEELAGLEASVVAEGCRDHLVVWKGHGILLDGHHRHEICGRHGLDYEVAEIDLPNRNAAKAWIIRNQLARRNLTPYQRAELAIALETCLPSRQGERSDLTSDRNRSEVERPSRQAAGIAGVGYDTYRKAKYVHERADADTKAKLRRGDTTINHEYKRLVQAEAKAERVASVRTAELPAGKFYVIVADPPWSYRNRPDDATHRARNPYPSMTVDQVKALPVAGLAHDDCILWLWCTNAHIVEAHQVAEAWGFQVKTMLTWAKAKMGLGDWLRGQTEHCLLAVRGKPVVTLTNQTTLLPAPVREHSRKPDEFYELVEGLCPGRKVELFAREVRDGFTPWGNEVRKFQRMGAA